MHGRPLGSALALAAAALAAGCFEMKYPERVEADCYEEDPGTCWMASPSVEVMYWDDANEYCETMWIGGYTWYLPNVDESRTLIAGCAETESGGDCSVSEEDEHLDTGDMDEDCAGCPSGGSCYWDAELYGSCGSTCYWTSSETEDDGNYAWAVLFDSGAITYLDKSTYCLVRCVAYEDD